MWEGMHTQLPGTGAREDEYQLLRSIGSGSFGQVFLVLHKEEHREFVMKSIDLHSASDEGRQQMELEVQLLRTMQHPNIVAYRDSFIDRTGHLCILMEYCEHGDIFTYLQEVRRTNSAPEEGRLLEWFTHIVWALQSLHQQKILHRDLKTQNIFLTGHRQQNILAAKLGDFGIAKVLTSTADLAKTQIGTPFYMSPELINSHPYSYKSDVWGLGCVLYEVVNGHRAFDAQSLNGLALKIIKGSYTPISASCSGPTKQLIQSMLSKSPAHRPSLKEILHMPAIRSKIPAAYRSSIAAGSSEARPHIEADLSRQLASLGLAALINAPAGPKRNRQKLQAKLERARDLKQREEQVLQQTIALLQQCLRDPSGIEDDREMPPPPPPCPPVPPVGRRDDSKDRVRISPRDSKDERPKMSPRSSFRRGDSRRDDSEHLRFSEQTAPIPSSNQRHRSTSTGSEAPDGPSRRPQRRGRSRARTEEVRPTNQADISSVSWMLEYDHVQPENLANPFQQCRQSVVHSSNLRHRPVPSNEPQPPPFHYGEPTPPMDVPPAAASARSWRTADGPWRANQHQQRSQTHSVKLQALPLPPRPRSHGAEDRDSRSSGSSLSFVDELNDARKGEVENTAWQRTLEERIDESKAALQKYRMTIDMLQYSFEHGDDVMISQRSVHEQGPVPLAPDDVAGWAGSRPAMPGVVQDCAARLQRRCLEALGLETLQQARRLVEESLDADEVPSSLRTRMLQLLGNEKIGFFSLIDQLVHMDRCWGAQEMA